MVGQTQLLEEGNFGHFFSQFAYSLKYLQLNTVWWTLEKLQADTKLATGYLNYVKTIKQLKEQIQSVQSSFNSIKDAQKKKGRKGT